MTDHTADAEHAARAAAIYARATGSVGATYTIERVDWSSGQRRVISTVTATSGDVTPPPVCFDGRDLIDAEPDACPRPATTTIPRAVWAPSATPDQYPDDVPACAEHAAEVWEAQDRAAARAEARATMWDYLT